jgi:hypothetical protein
MNKPDNTDRSRGQLTAGIDTCHLLQIQFPWTWIRETGQTHSFTAFRTYKEWVPVVLRVPSASTRIFSSRRRHGYIPAERIHVRIPGHTGWILGSYLRDIFQSRHSSFVTMTQLKNHMSQPSLTVPVYKIFGFIQPWSIKNSLPMGVMMLPESSFVFLAPVFMNKYHRVRAQRSRWESPEAIVEKFRV